MKLKRFLQEVTCVNDYGYNQPIAKTIRIINKISKLLNRTKFKGEIRKDIREDTWNLGDFFVSVIVNDVPFYGSDIVKQSFYFVNM